MDWNGRNDIKFIQIKWEEEKSSYKKEKMMKCNDEVESSGGGKEAKREVKCWREYNRRCGLIWRRRGFCCCLFIFKSSEKKGLKEKRRGRK